MRTHRPPVNDRAAFLAAIRAAPDDDLAHLAYADWLTERGDEDHAEFVRLGVRHAEHQLTASVRDRVWYVGGFPFSGPKYLRNFASAPVYPPLRLRAAFSRGLPGKRLAGGRMWIRRGVAVQVQAPASGLRDQLPALLAREPIVRVLASDVVPHSDDGVRFYLGPASNLPAARHLAALSLLALAGLTREARTFESPVEALLALSDYLIREARGKTR